MNVHIRLTFKCEDESDRKGTYIHLDKNFRFFNYCCRTGIPKVIKVFNHDLQFMWADVLASLSNRLSDKGKAKEALNFICQHAQNYLRQDIADTCCWVFF